MRRKVVTRSVLERIEKLKRLSESPNEHEAELAARRVMELMLAHAVTQADLDGLRAEREDPLEERRLHLDGLRMVQDEEKSGVIYQVSGWKRALAGRVADYLGLRSSYVPGTSRFTLYGHRTDLDAAVALYHVCARQIDRQCGAWLRAEGERYREMGEWWRWDAGRARTSGFEFRESAVRGLASKFNELSRESEDALEMTEEEEAAEAKLAAEEGRPPRRSAASSWGLVLDRRAKVASWVDANYTFKKGSGEGFGEAGWNAAGYAAGRKLDLRDDDAAPAIGSTGGRARALTGG